MGFITKELFLATLACGTKGWRQQRETAPKPLSIADELRIQEGLDIHARARKLYPDGVMVGGSNEECAEQTRRLLTNPSTTTIFEATFINGHFIAKADILVRTGSRWKLIEVKSNVNNSDELVNDIAYTAFVAVDAGLPISSCSLLMINKDFRLGMLADKLFVEVDHTTQVSVRAAEFEELSIEIADALSKTEEPICLLQWGCKGCDCFSACVGEGIHNHIFDLPRLSHTRFCQLWDLDIESIEGIPNNFKLTLLQKRVREAVTTGVRYIDRDGLHNALSSIRCSSYWLDFETVQTCLPLFQGVAPYEQLVTQYSLHVCNAAGEVLEHREYLADARRDCRRDLAETLLQDCGRQGSIVVYTSFEKTIIRALAQLFPDLEGGLEGLVGRLFDLCDVIRKHLYHQEFHGSFSIKKVLPVIVPYMNYAQMAVDNGMDASALFAFLAKGRYRGREAQKVRRNLREYCGLDTLAMVAIVQELRQMLEIMDEEERGERVAG